MRPDDSGASPGPVNPLDQLASNATGRSTSVTNTKPLQPKPAKKAPARPARTAPASRTRTAAPAPQDMTLESVLVGIRAHESGGNYTAKNPRSTASGAYQYLDSTWNNYGGYKHASDAPPAVQDARARADLAANYKKYGDWRKVVAAHFAGSGWVDKHPDVNTWDQNPVPGSNNPTVAQYVASVFQSAGVSSDPTGQITPNSPAPTAAATRSTATTATGSTATASDALPTNATPQQIKDRVARDYGYLAAFLNVPEVGAILQRAAREDWDENTLAGALSKTNWWKTTSASARQWDALNLTDHATAKAQVDAKIVEIQTAATKLGLVLSPIRVHDIAVNSLRLGFTSQQLTDAMLHEGKLDTSGKTPTDALSIRTTLRQRASQYLVPMADVTLDKWTQDIVAGKVSQESFDAYLKTQAKSLFPSMSQAIDDGVTVEQYVDPYKQIAADLLSVPIESINFNDPKWSKALFQIDPKTGARTTMSLDQWGRTLRTDDVYGFGNTAKAINQGAEFATQLVKTFGKVAS